MAKNKDFKWETAIGTLSNLWHSNFLRNTKAHPHASLMANYDNFACATLNVCAFHLEFALGIIPSDRCDRETRNN